MRGNLRKTNSFGWTVPDFYGLKPPGRIRDKRENILEQDKYVNKIRRNILAYNGELLVKYFHGVRNCETYYIGEAKISYYTATS